MAGLSVWHILLFAIVLILLFGTSKLKNLGRDLGGAVKDFKNSVKDEDAQAQEKIEHDRVIDSQAHSAKTDKNSHSNHV